MYKILQSLQSEIYYVKDLIHDQADTCLENKRPRNRQVTYSANRERKGPLTYDSSSLYITIKEISIAHTTQQFADFLEQPLLSSQALAQVLQRGKLRIINLICPPLPRTYYSQIELAPIGVRDGSHLENSSPLRRASTLLTPIHTLSIPLLSASSIIRATQVLSWRESSPYS
jgi:hypothetical protein